MTEPASTRAGETAVAVNEVPRGHRPRRGAMEAIVLVFFATLVCHLPGITTAPLAGTEGHRALAAHQMVTSGSWLVPRLYGQLFLTKPPLHYWLIAATERAIGHGGAFVWRLPSVLCGAATNALLAFFAARWFGGRVAGLVSGFAGLMLLCLWGQTRTADIDALDTLASTAAALCLLELHLGPASRKRKGLGWECAAALAVAATFMTKGPAGLPPIVGVLAWIGWVACRRGRLVRWAASPRTWGPILLGCALFAAYAGAVAWALHRSHEAPDWGGVEEGVGRLHLWTSEHFKYALILPFTLFAFSLPVSLALPVVVAWGIQTRTRRGAAPSPHRTTRRPGRLLIALAGSVLISWVVCVASGMTNPRYGHVTVPLLCVLAGGLVARSRRLPEPERRRLTVAAAATPIILFGAQVVLVAMVWRGSSARPWLVVAAVASLIVLAFSLRPLTRHRRWPDWRGVVLLTLLLSVPYSSHFNQEREGRSGRDAAPLVRQVVGNGAYVIVGGMMRSQPEIFYYAGVDAHLYGHARLPDPSQFPGGYWVVLDAEEYKFWTRQVGPRLSRIIPFESHKVKGYIAWYATDGVSPVPSNAPATPPSPPT